MATHSTLIEFRSPFGGCTVDEQAGVIRGVSLITAGIKAKGHDLHVDEVTLKQLLSCLESKGQVPVRAKHGGAVSDTVGWVENGRIEGNKLRADLHLLESIPNRAQYLEIAKVLPQTAGGLSVAFEPPEKDVMVNGRKMARCKDLVSVDFAGVPAANPDGLFSAPVVDMPQKPMNPGDNSKEPTMAEVLAAIQGLQQTVNGLSEKVAAIEAPAGDEDGLDADDLTLEGAQALMDMSDEELAEVGIEVDREALSQVIEQRMAEAAEGDQGGEGDGDPEAEGAVGAQAAAPVGAGAAAAPAGSLAAINQRLTQLESGIEAAVVAEERANVLQQFSTIEEALTALQAENKALREQLDNPAGRAVNGQTRDAIGFDRKPGGYQPGTFEHQVAVLMEAGKKRSVAMLEAIQKHPELHREWRARQQKPGSGTVELGA